MASSWLFRDGDCSAVISCSQLCGPPCAYPDRYFLRVKDSLGCLLFACDFSDYASAFDCLVSNFPLMREVA